MKQELTSEEKSGLAERIKYVRQKVAHQTQKEFAFSLYVSRAYINQLENCKVSILPSDTFFLNICSKYGISEEWIRFGHKPILQSEIKEMIEESKLYFTEQLSSHYLTNIQLDLKDVLDPHGITEEQYAKIIDTFVILSRPFFSFMKILKEDMMKNGKNTQKLYDDYLQELENTIAIDSK